MTNQDFKNKEFEIMQESWKMYKEFYTGSDADDDKFWSDLVNNVIRINTKYNTDFCRELTELFLNDIERRSKNGKR